MWADSIPKGVVAWVCILVFPLCCHINTRSNGALKAIVRQASMKLEEAGHRAILPLLKSMEDTC